MPYPPVVTVQYASSGWSAQLGSAIAMQRHVRIVIRGALASTLKAQLGFPQVCTVPAPPFSGVPIPYPNIGHCLASLPTLASHVALAWTTKGYTSIKASFDLHGSGSSDNELAFDLR